MMNGSIQARGSCQCGQAKFSISQKPLLRFYCHCLICQEFNQSDYADVTVFYRKDVVLVDENAVTFRVHQQPPLLSRGKCTSCGKPAIEKLSIPLMPKMTIIPSSNLEDTSFLPEPKLHIFYHRRKADFADTLPKYSGFLNSQCQFSLAAAKAMLRKSGT